MQVGVHRLRVVLVLVGKTHILDRVPHTGAGLDVTSTARVETVLFYAVIERLGKFQGFLIACGPEIFRQTIDREGDGIELLFRVLRAAFEVEAPEDAAIFLVRETVSDLIVGSGGRVEIFLFSEHPVR